MLPRVAIDKVISNVILILLMPIIPCGLPSIDTSLNRSRFNIGESMRNCERETNDRAGGTQIKAAAFHLTCDAKAGKMQSPQFLIRRVQIRAATHLPDQSPRVSRQPSPTRTHGVFPAP